MVALGQTYECKPHPEWKEDKQFLATLNIAETNSRIAGELISISLSEAWPLNESCSEPKAGMRLVGSREGSELKLGLEKDNECGFVFYIVVSGSNPAMLSPRQTLKINGHKPYLASCNAI